MNTPFAWLNFHAAAIQAVCALVVAMLTAFLVFFSGLYVTRATKAIEVATDALTEQRASIQLLREQIEQEKQALKLSKDEFEREWQPQ